MKALVIDKNIERGIEKRDATIEPLQNNFVSSF
jgi:hypothetical protein